jgi:tRNA(Arg) A34 adenosine deaminase TadA
MTEADERYLRRAIELAAEARAAGDMPFGSLLVGPGGDVLAEDRNTVLTEQDITAHPELKLARWAARRLEPETARQITMYTSCQPCPMCTGALGAGAGGVRALRRAVAGAQTTRGRRPGRGSGRLRGSCAARRGARPDRGLLHMTT